MINEKLLHEDLSQASNDQLIKFLQKEGFAERTLILKGTQEMNAVQDVIKGYGTMQLIQIVPFDKNMYIAVHIEKGHLNNENTY